MRLEHVAQAADAGEHRKNHLLTRRIDQPAFIKNNLIVALLAAFFNPPDSAVTSPDIEYVQRVVDGDTLLFGTGERVRLIGIDTPETKHPNKPVEQLGKEASAFTRKMVEGKRVRLEYDPSNTARGHKDQYGRTLAFIFLEDGTLPNAEI